MTCKKRIMWMFLFSYLFLQVYSSCRNSEVYKKKKISFTYDISINSTTHGKVIWYRWKAKRLSDLFLLYSFTLHVRKVHMDERLFLFFFHLSWFDFRCDVGRKRKQTDLWFTWRGGVSQVTRRDGQVIKRLQKRPTKLMSAWTNFASLQMLR